MEIRSPSTVAQTLKRLMQLIATLAGFSGILMLPVSLGMLVTSTPNREPISLLFVVLFLLIDIYLLWLCYYVWFKFSPRAVLHVCGLFALLALDFPSKVTPSSWNTEWLGAIGFVWVLFVIYGCRILSDCLNRIIFNPHAPPPRAV